MQANVITLAYYSSQRTHAGLEKTGKDDRKFITLNMIGQTVMALM